MNTALILVDLQNQWRNPQSPDYIDTLNSYINKVNKLISQARQNNLKIIFIRHVEKDSINNSWQEGTTNTELFKELNHNPKDTIITKNKISAFYQTKLGKELKGISKIVIAGILTNLCVRSLIHDAYDRDYKITVVKDCCKTYDKRTQTFTFQDLKNTRPEIEFIHLKNFLL